MGPEGPQGLPGTAALVVEAGVTVSDLGPGVTAPLADDDPDRICFLAHVEAEQVDSGTEVGRCSVDFDAVAGWTLTGLAGDPGNASVTCSARCLSW